MVYLKTFQFSKEQRCRAPIYPYTVLKGKDPGTFVFDPITVLYGNNGSGKSTILNLIAHTLSLKGKERTCPPIDGIHPYFETFASSCSYALGSYEGGKSIDKIPEGSRYIKSEEILYEIRKIQQDAILEESYVSDHIRQGMKKEKAKKILQTQEGQVQWERMQFAQDKYSNGETTLQILLDNIQPDKLYLLDEPEVSLSPQNQVALSEKLNQFARYLGAQFIIATHSPFMLGILNAKIYNLDTKTYQVQPWNTLENVQFFYHFFKEHENEFESERK